MADLFAVLSADHQRIFELSNQLTGGAGIASGAPKERKRLATELVIEESRHEVLEEQWLWPQVRARLSGGDALALAGLSQEQGAKRLLNELEHMSPGNDEFASVIDRIASAVRDHITFEESQVLPKLRLALDDEQAERIGENLARSRRLAPTRPHPHTPPAEVAIKTVGMAVAVVDRARDALTGRGRS